MFFVGIDLHKKTITVCVVNQQRCVVQRKTFHCCQPDKIREFFSQLGAFQAVVEATASYEWLWQLLEPLAERLVLAHPQKMRIIAETTRKTDKIDAEVLATFLALNMIPQAYRPSPRQRQHRTLVRQRCRVQGRITSVKNKLRHILSDYNADRKDLFTAEGLAYLTKLCVSAADRYVVDQLQGEYEFLKGQLRALDKQLRTFARQAPTPEAEAREVLASMPMVGDVTVNVVVSELGDIQRFRSAKCVAAYAGLAPGRRESAGRSREMPISKTGSRLLRWVLVQTAWRMVQKSRRWQCVYEGLCKRRGKKKAIIAVARRLLGVMAALLRSGQRYRLAS